VADRGGGGQAEPLIARRRSLGRAAALAATLTLLAVVVLLASGVTSTSGGQREQRVNGASFRTTIDARWTIVTRRGARGFETFALSSDGARLGPDGIPPARAIGITITESATSALARRAGGGREPQPREAIALSGASARARRALELLSRVVRTPARAVGVEPSEPPRLRTLAGASAAEEAYEYVYSGRGNVQVDVVARHGAKIYFIELDTQLAQLATGESAFARLLRNWRWE
jgi:hypothetical protein